MIPIYMVDAFTDVPFAGNPAAVCLLDMTSPWPSDTWLQCVAREMNLSETAFLRHREGLEFALRWLTPKIEVSLCGHATLAAAHMLWESGCVPRVPLIFATKSGSLTATPLPSGEIELDFPARPATPCEPPTGMLEALGAKAIAVGHNSDDYFVVGGNRCRSAKPRARLRGTGRNRVPRRDRYQRSRTTRGSISCRDSSHREPESTKTR